MAFTLTIKRTGLFNTKKVSLEQLLSSCNFKWNGQNYLFAMNGQTGKFVGDLPVDKGKKRRTFAAIYVSLALAMTACMLMFGNLAGLLGL